MDKNKKNNERYYWLKLDRNFFKDARIKKLRKLAGGDTYTIIYLKLMLLSIEFGGMIIYEGIEDSIEEELALKIDEASENVSVAVNFLKAQGLMIEVNGDFELIQAKKSIGSETYNNVYKRNKNLEKFQVNSKSIPIDIDKEIDKEIDILLPHTCVHEEEEFTSITTLDEITSFVQTNNLNVNPKVFFNHYNALGWKLNNKPISNWKVLLLTWEKNKVASSTASSAKDPEWLDTYISKFEDGVDDL